MLFGPVHFILKALRRQFPDLIDEDFLS